jgi:DNA-binding NarL/FixJ family response regulator
MPHRHNTRVENLSTRESLSESSALRSGRVPQTRILIVDDSPSVRIALRKFLEQNSSWLVCGEAEDGQEAVDRVRQLKPDLVVMDFLMPVQDGLHASEQIKGLFPEIPILLCTMFASSQLSQKARSAGVKGILPKTNIARIGEAIGALLHGDSFYPSLTD